MTEGPGPADPQDNIDDLFAAFDAGELDVEPVSSEERRRMQAAAGLVSRAQAGAEPPPALKAQVLERIRAEADAEPPGVVDLGAARARRRRWARPLAVAGAAAAAAALVAILALPRGQEPGSPQLFDAELAAVPGGLSPGAEGGAEIFRLGDGYEVRLEAEGLAPTTGNRSYVLWYVGTGDRRGRPRRVSIGSFRTKNGTVRLRWPAAFDVARFHRVSITLEPRDDGDPGVNGPEVMRGRSERVHGTSG